MCSGPAKIEAFREQHALMCEDNWVCNRLSLRKMIVEDAINPPLNKTTTIILQNLHALSHSNYCPTGHSSRSLKAPLATNSCGFSTTSTNLICESVTATIKSISWEPLAFASEQNGVSKHYVSGNSNYFFLFSILLVLPTR